MNHELSTTEAKRIDTLALALSLCPSLDWDRDKHNWIEGFKAGAGLLQGFAEFCENEYFTIQNPSIAVAKYIQFITDKSKQDGK